MLAFLITGLMKAKFHLEYLKLVNPDKYGKESIIEAFIFGWNPEVQFLCLPYFYRNRAKEHPNACNLVRKIWFMLAINCGLFILLLTPMILCI